jgi:chromatin modification-related protein EAF6
MSTELGDEKARYESLRKELMQALPKKLAIDKQLAQIEVQIYNLEATYLTETAAHSGGNIIQGFEGYLKNQSVGRRKYEVSEADRIFSTSSLTYQKSLELLGEVEESSATAEDCVKQSTPGLTTVIVPPATKTQELSAAQQKKNRDREYQRKKRANLSRRSTGTISDEEHVSTSSGRRATKRARLDDD